MNKRAVSPVIATIIIIAVAVALAIAIAFWAGALTGQFSKYGKLHLNITTHYASSISGGWQVVVSGTNEGSEDLTITQVEIDGIPYSSFAGASINASLPIQVLTGKSFSFSLYIPGTAFSSGEDIQLAIITAQGVSYPLSINLP